jgi:integrase
MNASVMLAEGIPDKYSMKRMGHATNNMLKTTYQHTIKEKETVYDQKIDARFEELFKPE